jgi:hypothetical protein
MSNTTLKAFHNFPIEENKIGETISIPKVEDYLKELKKNKNFKEIPKKQNILEKIKNWIL